MITQQPVDAAYVQGAQAPDLVVAAANAHGEGALAYEWFAKDGETVTSTGVKTANLPVDTATVGSKTFFCRVTNASGLSVDSNAVTVTVKAPEAKPEPKPETKPGTSGTLAQTGDPASIALFASLVGAGAVTMGVRRTRRSNRDRVC